MKYVLLSVFIAIVAWLLRGWYDIRKSEMFKREKQIAVARARTILVALRDGTRAEYSDKNASIDEVFDLKYVSLKEIGTTREEIKRLLMRSERRNYTRFVAGQIKEGCEEGMLERYLSELPSLLWSPK